MRLTKTLLRHSPQKYLLPAIQCICNACGTTPVSGESGGGLKKATVQGMMCLCKTVQQSRWTRRNNFARTRRVLQEAKSERAIDACMTANSNAIAVQGLNRRLVLDEERCWKDYESQRY